MNSKRCGVGLVLAFVIELLGFVMLFSGISFYVGTWLIGIGVGILFGIEVCCYD